MKQNGKRCYSNTTIHFLIIVNYWSINQLSGQLSDHFKQWEQYVCIM